MIKRYILHIEAHRNIFRYRPRISFKRAPQHGDRVVDGGVPGTLQRCPTCQEGFLHEPDPFWENVRPRQQSNPPLMGLFIEGLVKNLAKPSPRPTRPVRSYHAPRPAMDFNGPTHVELKMDEPKAEHVELKLDEPTPEVVKLTVEEESPETLELDYKLGTKKHKRGDILWTHKAEYVVDKLEDDVLYLVRKDVWKARKKKTKHVELKLEDEKPSEVVKLEVEEEKPSEVVTLKFD